MTPYFQLVGSINKNRSMEGAQSCLQAAIEELQVKGLEMVVTKVPQREEGEVIVWNVAVPGVNDSNESEWMKVITNVSRRHELEQRFRFPTFIKLHGKGGAQT